MRRRTFPLWVLGPAFTHLGRGAGKSAATDAISEALLRLPLGPAAFPTP